MPSGKQRGGKMQQDYDLIRQLLKNTPELDKKLDIILMFASKPRNRRTREYYVELIKEVCNATG